MRELGISRGDVKMVLNHVETDVTARYDRYDGLAEKRRALDISRSSAARLPPRMLSSWREREKPSARIERRLDKRATAPRFLADHQCGRQRSAL
jgi:hypothetical protein